MNKKRYCECCEEEILHVRTVVNKEISIEEIKFNMNYIMNQCANCETEIYIEKDNMENVRVGHELYKINKKEESLRRRENEIYS